MATERARCYRLMAIPRCFQIISVVGIKTVIIIVTSHAVSVNREIIYRKQIMVVSELVCH